MSPKHSISRLHEATINAIDEEMAESIAMAFPEMKHGQASMKT